MMFLINKQNKHLQPICHPERSEGSHTTLYFIKTLHQILHCVQDDTLFYISQ